MAFDASERFFVVGVAHAVGGSIARLDAAEEHGLSSHPQQTATSCNTALMSNPIYT